MSARLFRQNPRFDTCDALVLLKHNVDEFIILFVKPTVNYPLCYFIVGHDTVNPLSVIFQVLRVNIDSPDNTIFRDHFDIKRQIFEILF